MLEKRTKICAKCGEELDVSEFVKRGNGLYSYCKQCKKLISAKYREKNRETLRVKATEYNQTHKEEHARYRETHKEQYRLAKIKQNKLHSNYFHGTLNPMTTTGIGVITEYVVENILGDCVNCNKENFHAQHDLISKSYGTVNVKSSKLYYNKNYNSYYWHFAIKEVAAIPNNYICIGFNDDKTKITNIWIILNNSSLISKSGIVITNSERGLKRAKEYEIDPTPYQELFTNLNLNEIEEFRNIGDDE